MISISRATIADAEVCCRIHIESRARAMPWLAVVHSPREVMEWFRGPAMQHQEFWVAGDAGGVAGYMAMNDQFLSHLYIDPSRQRRGIGTALFRYAKSLRPNGFKLFVFQRNLAARQFYERHGCRQIGETDGSTNEEREPDVIYQWP